MGWFLFLLVGWLVGWLIVLGSWTVGSVSFGWFGCVWLIFLACLRRAERPLVVILEVGWLVFFRRLVGRSVG